ncbi:unnamed protein product, partial [marine sediment metagenome]
VYIVHDNSGDLTVNAKSGKAINLAIDGADEFAFGAATLDMHGNALDNCGSIILNTDSQPAGTQVYLVHDNSGDLTLNALTNKVINFAIAGTDEMQLSGSELKVDVIDEITGAAGVTIESVLLKDSHIQFGNATNPANTTTYVSRDNSGDFTIHTVTGKAINLAIVGNDVIRVEGDKISLLQDISTDQFNAGDSNVFLGMGIFDGGNMTGSSYNVIIGYKAAYDSTTAHHSVIIGAECLEDITYGQGNVAVGYHVAKLATAPNYG